MEHRIELTQVAQSNHAKSRTSVERRLSVASVTASLIQGICLFAVGINWAKVALGVTSVTVIGGSSLLHSEPARYALRYLSAILATATLWVIWNGWRLRRRASARWRWVPLTSSEKWNIAIGLGSSILSWLLIIAEAFAHQKMHPR